jgi:hypothetical protein
MHYLKVSPRQLVLCLIVFLSCCSSYKKLAADEIRQLDVISSFPYLYTAGEFQYFTDSISLFLYQGLEIFRIPIESSTSTLDSILSTKIVYMYFVGKPCDSEYYSISPLDSSTVRISADSVIKTYAMGTSMLSADPNRKKIEEVSLSKNLTLQKYTMIKRAGTYPIDSVYLYLDSKVQPFCYSLARSYDNSNMAKLIKIRVIYNQVGRSYDSNYLPKREKTVEFKERKVVNKPVIDSVIHLYKMAANLVTRR